MQNLSNYLSIYFFTKLVDIYLLQMQEHEGGQGAEERATKHDTFQRFICVMYLK